MNIHAKEYLMTNFNNIIQLLGYRFFQYALIGGSVAALACALVGLFVVLRKESMIGDGVAHISFGGIALGLFLDVDPILSALMVSIASVLGISYLKRRGLAESSSAIALMLAVGFSTGLIIISLAGGFNIEIFSFLFGSILTINNHDLIIISALGAITILVVGVFYKELLSITFDEEASRLMGIPVKELSALFNILLATTIVLSIKVVGMILVTALIVLPSLTALQLNRDFRMTAILSIVVGVVSVVLGVFISAIFDVATSGVIVFTLVTMFLAVSGVKMLA